VSPALLPPEGLPESFRVDASHRVDPAEHLDLDLSSRHAVINLGIFNSADRMQRVLGLAGEHRWGLVAVYDKASNWLRGLEKGFMLFKRSVPNGIRPGFWCVSTRAARVRSRGCRRRPADRALPRRPGRRRGGPVLCAGSDRTDSPEPVVATTAKDGFVATPTAR
jgi:hypothetical protein